MKNTKKLIFITTLLLLGISCREDDFDVLPRETQVGLNTFGCIIDGALLTPEDGEPGFGGGRTAKGLKMYRLKDESILQNTSILPYFAIQASNFMDRGGDYIYVYIPSLFNLGVYIIHDSNGYTGIDSPRHPHVLAIIYDRKGNGSRYLSYYNSGEINITRFDTINTIISGTFHLRMVDEETKTDTIEITQGVFDINWTTLNCGKYGEQPCQS